jgi:hypothetical protein
MKSTTPYTVHVTCAMFSFIQPLHVPGGQPRTFGYKFIQGVQYITIVYHSFGQSLHEDLTKQRSFINRFLEPVHFTFVEAIEDAYWDQDVHVLYYKRHVSTEEHDCVDSGCDDWCIYLSNTEVHLLIKYQDHRKVEFTKDHYTRIYHHFFPIFNIMRLAFTSTRSITALNDYFERTPHWCERMRTDVDAVDTAMFPYSLFSVSLFYPLFSRRCTSLPLTRRLLQKEAADKTQRKHAAVRKVQDRIHMRAIPRILLIVPMGKNPYADYVTRFFKNVDIYEMMYQSKYGTPVIHQDVVLPEVSLSLDNSEHSFMTFFSSDSDNTNMFYIVARRTRLEDPALDVLFNTPSKEARAASMKKVLEMFFIGRNLTAHLERINQLTVCDACDAYSLTEESFIALFDIYINVSMSYTRFRDLTDTSVIHLAYLAECMGDTTMVRQSIDYFLGFRFEYLYRLWQMAVPAVSPNLTLPYVFKRGEDITPDMMYGPHYGWDEHGRDA